VPRRAAVFLNEGAGSARTNRVRRAVELARRALDADLHVTATRDVAELDAWLRERIDGYTTAVIAGGDGSLGVAFNVAAGRDDLAIGYLPAGFGNATRHLLRLPAQPEEQAEVLRRGDVRAVDLVAVDDRLALFVGAGWDAIVARRYAEAGARKLPGWAAAVARSIPDLWRRHRVEVRADGWVVHRGPMELLVVGTTPFYGRGLRVNPGARPDASVLALRIYPGPAPRLAAEAARWAFRVSPDAERIDAQRVEVRALDGVGIPVQADGDVIGEREAWAMEVRPAAVRLIGRWS
jgi:diacylglycerol kinase (ATP)